MACWVGTRRGGWGCSGTWHPLPTGPQPPHLAHLLLLALPLLPERRGRAHAVWRPRVLPGLVVGGPAGPGGSGGPRWGWGLSPCPLHPAPAGTPSLSPTSGRTGTSLFTSGASGGCAPGVGTGAPGSGARPTAASPADTSTSPFSGGAAARGQPGRQYFWPPPSSPRTVPCGRARPLGGGGGAGAR